MNKSFTINQFPKEEIFTLPENYFEQLEKNILAKTIHSTNVVHVSFYKRYSKIFAIGIAASLVVLGFSYSLFKQQTDSNIDKQLSSISNNDIVQYLQEDDLSMLD